MSIAKHVGHLKLGSKPAQLYVRLRIRPLGIKISPSFYCIITISFKYQLYNKRDNDQMKLN